MGRPVLVGVPGADWSDPTTIELMFEPAADQKSGMMEIHIRDLGVHCPLEAYTAADDGVVTLLTLNSPYDCIWRRLRGNGHAHLVGVQYNKANNQIRVTVGFRDERLGFYVQRAVYFASWGP